MSSGAPVHSEQVVTADGVRLAVEVRGDGPTVLLLHGFASQSHMNWVRPGVVDGLVAAGHRVVTYDARGHGRSDKPHEPQAYSSGVMVRDARSVIDELGIDHLDVVGYSMGAQTTAALVGVDARVQRAVLGGIGNVLLLPGPASRRYPATAIAEALETDDPTTIEGATPRAFRAFADATKADKAALAALQRGRDISGGIDLAAITVPVLVVVGDRDTLIGDPAPVVAALADARLVVVPGDHLSAVVAPEFTAALVSFLAA